MHINCLNEVMSCRASEIKPFVGMAGTEFVGSDRYAIVVTDVISDKKILISKMWDDDYKSLDENEKLQCLETSRMGKYMTLSEDKKHLVPVGIVYTYRKNNRWIQEGQSLWGTGAIHLGHADNYLDPCF